jgi:hypothetical protein
MNVKELYSQKLFEESKSNLSIGDFKQTIWLNNRQNKNYSLRLTEKGYKLLEEVLALKNYQVELDKNLKMTSQILIWLDKFIDSPYYLEKNKLTVFKESTAFELYLFSGDLKKMGYAKAMAIRLTDSES